MKRCSTPLIRKIKIKTTVRCHLTPVRMAISNKSTNNKCWQGSFLHCWWECRLVQPLWKAVWFPQKIKNGTSLWPSNPNSEYITKGTENRVSKSYQHSHVHRIAHNSPDMETTKCPQQANGQRTCGNGILFSHEKEGSPVISNNMDEPRGHYAKWTKSDRGNQIPHGTTYCWNLKKRERE